MNTADLAFALKLAAPCIVTSNYIKVLSHYCFTKDTVFAHDDVSAIIVNVRTGLNCALHGETLSRFIDLCGKQIEFTADGEGKVGLKSGRTKAELPSLGPKEFYFKMPEEKYSLDVAMSEELLGAFAICVAGVSKDPLLHKEWTAAALQLGAAPAMFAFDGTSLVRVGLAKSLGKKDRKLLIPESVCRQIVDTASALSMKDGGEVAMKIGSDHIRVDFGGAVHLIGKLLPEEAPDYETNIAQIKTSKAFAMPKGFHRAVGKVAVVTGNSMEPLCTIAVDGTRMIVSGSGDFGEAETNLKLEREAKPCSASVAPDRLLRYQDQLLEISVDPDGIAMHGDSLDYYTTTKE
jgi:DNA polymerase III sliding clamp (beta) subunit (PCNA family)